MQAVIQVRVRPDSFQIRPGTLGNKYWPNDLRFDEHFPTYEGLEWLSDNISGKPKN